jgi:hypothetical protein
LAGNFDDGKRLAAQGRYAESCPKLAESQRLDPAPGTLMNLADCYENAGLTASAWATWLEAASATKQAGQVEREWLVPCVQLGAAVINATGTYADREKSSKADCELNGVSGCDSLVSPHVGIPMGSDSVSCSRRATCFAYALMASSMCSAPLSVA